VPPISSTFAATQDDRNEARLIWLPNNNPTPDGYYITCNPAPSSGSANVYLPGGSTYSYIYPGITPQGDYNYTLSSVYQGITGNYLGVTGYKPPPSPSGICFAEGSKIETISGYVKIEDLKKGDLVRTYKNGFKAITGILKQEIYYRKENKEENHLYCLKKETFGELIEDLVLTGDHLILVDDASTAKGGKKDVLIKVDGKLGLRCSKDKRSVLLEEWGTTRIYNLSVGKKRHGIYANGLLVSSGDEREFHLLEKGGAQKFHL